MSEDIKALVELYQELKRKYEEVGLLTDYLKATAGVELFNTDGEWLKPAESHVLSSLVEAEHILNRQLYDPKTVILDENKRSSQIHLIERIVNEEPVTPSELANFKHQREITAVKSELLVPILEMRVSTSKDYLSLNGMYNMDWTTNPKIL